MTATTHTEIYRPLRGAVRDRRLRFLPLVSSEIRTAAKNRLALLVLFAPIGIATVIYSFVMYAKFALESVLSGQGMGPQAGAVAALAGQLIEVRTLIVQVFFLMGYFALLIMAWFGAGLIAEDRRLGAHLLYFARPLTRFDYWIAKFLALSFYGALASLVPSLVICTVASFSSPNWSFVVHEGRIFWQVTVFSVIWITTLATVVLCISSLVARKTYGLVATFGLFAVSRVVAELLANLQHEPRFRVLSLDGNLQRVAAAVFGIPDIMEIRMDWDLSLSCWVLAATIVFAGLVTALRIRRMEAAA